MQEREKCDGASTKSRIGWATGLSALLLGLAAAPAWSAPDVATLQSQAKAIFGPLPANAATEAHPMTPARVELGRVLYFDPRFSKNHDISCNTCHPLDNFGADGEKTSPGHRGQRGDRNSPTSLNAALHFAQFWDGRAADVEAQAKGPVLNPIEMGMPSEAAVLVVLKSIPGYAPKFKAAFPQDADPISYENMAIAIGAFERGLITPGPLDRFMAGDATALSGPELDGLQLFITKGCVTCHNGPAVGGGMYRMLGQVKPYPSEDIGREKVTGRPEDRFVFKVPSLRNVAKTGPYFHDGSLATLDEVVPIMAIHQLGVQLTDAEVQSIIAFLGTLTGTIDPAYVKAPTLPKSGPKTPAPDPS
jgi:cytochrome c peroxidase